MYINKKLHDEEDALLPRPVSPVSQSLHNSTITMPIFAVFEFETPINESETLDFLRNDFVPISPRFSWIIETDKKGVPTWKKVEIRYEDHLIVPTFPTELQTKEEYDERLKEYISEISCEGFIEGIPLWEVHLIKYPSLNGVRSLVFKLSHAIGDGYSYVKLLFCAFKRAGNPSLPFSVPQLSFSKKNGKAVGRGKKFLQLISKTAYSTSDVSWSLLKAMAFKEPPSVIRSETAAMELFRPINIYVMTFSLGRLNQLKSKLRVTMNDLIMGTISYMIHLYMVKMGQQISSNDSNLTILVMVNMRQLKGYKTFEEMINAPDSWGNHSRMLTAPIPSFNDSKKMNPVDFIIKAKETMSRKKKSFFLDVLDPVLNILRGIKGQKAMNELLHSSFRNSSTMITSVIGPKEQMAIGKHPVSSFYYLVTGVPQSVSFTTVSCSGEMKLVATMEKGFIDYQIFSSCMNEAFENVFQAAAATALPSNSRSTNGNKTQKIQSSL